MPLGIPPAATELETLPAISVAVMPALHRVARYRTGSAADMWWFSSAAGRYDLPAPEGACYFATSAAGAMLEAFQDFTGVLPEAELRARRRYETDPPDDAPAAADLTAPAGRGCGVTVDLWGGGRAGRSLTQAWAVALRAAGWRALHHGIQHDPAALARAITLFDDAGAHPPTTSGPWRTSIHTLHDDEALHRDLAPYGIRVIADPDPVTVPLNELLRAMPHRHSLLPGTRAFRKRSGAAGAPDE